MDTLGFTLVVGAGSFGAGLLGSLTGLGGGVVVIPLLALGFGVDIRYAVGAALVSVIATSSGAAAAYLREGYTNMRLGMFLEVATTCGAIGGALASAFVAPGWLGATLGAVLLYSAYLTARPRHDHAEVQSSSPWAQRLHLDSTYPTAQGRQPYGVQGIPAGFALMFAAGILSGLLGIGAGAFKVLGMDQIMRVPFKVSTTTSNFMIGVTAATGAGIYLHRGYIDPGLAMPVMLGVLAGSMLGARLLMKIRTRTLRRVFSAVIAVVALEMIYKGITGGFSR
jgi:uncharacterized membrane protein YfcA